MINVYSYDEKQLLDLSGLISSVILVDQAGDLEDIDLEIIIRCTGLSDKELEKLK